MENPSLEQTLQILALTALSTGCVPDDCEDEPEMPPLFFPVEEDSLRPEEQSVVAGFYGLRSNFGDKRGSTRLHAACDVYTVGKGRVVSIDDGVVNVLFVNSSSNTSFCLSGRIRLLPKIVRSTARSASSETTAIS